MKEITEEEWRKELSEEEFQILRQKGTERSFSGKYWNAHEDGIYKCVGCGEPIFSSEHKFESGSGWPSFYNPIEDDKIDDLKDRYHGMKRTEVLYKSCGGHLGHVFKDGPKPTGLRYCINSASLSLKKVNCEFPK